MSKKSRKETEASKFLEEPSEEGQEAQDVSESEGKAVEADQKKPEPAKEKPAMKSDALSSEIPGKFRKFQ